MAYVPKGTVRALLAQEHQIPAARLLATRRGVEPQYDEEGLTLRLPVTGKPATEGDPPEQYLVVAALDDYDVLPPVWRFLDPRNSGDIGPAAYPAATPNSVFHTAGVVCAPWNRLAYRSENPSGPHTDWGPPTDWKTAAPTSTHATTVPDMLDRLFRDLARSRGRMADLPPLP